MVFRTLSMQINKSSKNADFEICLGGLKSAVILILLAWFYWRPLLEGDFEICLAGPKFDQTFKPITLLTRIKRYMV